MVENIIKTRVKRLFELAEDKDLSHIIIMNGPSPYIDANFFYLTGVTSGIFEDSYVVASKDGEVTVITGMLEAETARSTGLNVVVPMSRKRADFDEALRVSLMGADKIGINYSGSTTKSYVELKETLANPQIVDVSLVLDKARLIKDANELAIIKKAAELSSATFKIIKKSIKDKLTENELAAIINYNIIKLGASSAAFDTICGFGKNSAEPHHIPNQTKVSKGDFIVCDYGAKYNRYCSDITRTFIYKSPDEKRKDIYKTVFLAQKAALEKISPGVKGFEVYKAAETVIDGAGYNGRFIHGIGHSLGLETHDSSILNPGGDLLLEEGMVLTVEPGVYLPGFGGVRIEDDIVVTKGGYKMLTDAPKELEDVIIL
jgi:Xaa-Pro dipeptidase